jgi:hypothetical protein
MDGRVLIAVMEKITTGAVPRKVGCIAEFRIASAEISSLPSHAFRRWKVRYAVFQKVLFGRT